MLMRNATYKLKLPRPLNAGSYNGKVAGDTAVWIDPKYSLRLGIHSVLLSDTELDEPAS